MNTIIGLILLFTFIEFSGFTQNPDGFDKTCETFLRKTVPVSRAQEITEDIKNGNSIVILDTREIDEYEVSHIPLSLWVGYNNFKIKDILDLPKDTKIYVYCSVGYRSERIGEKLQEEGFKNVYNLYGGIFNWGNNGLKLIDSNDKETIEIHGFNEEWSNMINKDRCRPVIE